MNFDVAGSHVNSGAIYTASNNTITKSALQVVGTNLLEGQRGSGRRREELSPWMQSVAGMVRRQASRQVLVTLTSSILVKLTWERFLCASMSGGNPFNKTSSGSRAKPTLTPSLSAGNSGNPNVSCIRTCHHNLCSVSMLEC